MCLDQDMKIGHLNIRKDTTIIAKIEALHKNSAEWQRPYEFLPQRWDKGDPVSLRPDGKSRNNYSFLPFMGGKRICFGKTFALANLRFMTTYLA